MKHHLFRFGKAENRGSGRFETDGFDREKQVAVIRSSICTGEKVAGFRDKNGGHFIEVMLIRSKKDEEEFKRTYGIDELNVEY